MLFGLFEYIMGKGKDKDMEEDFDIGYDSGFTQKDVQANYMKAIDVMNMEASREYRGSLRKRGRR